MEYEPLDERRPPSVSAPPRRRSRRLLRWTWPILAALLIGAISGVAIAAAIHVPRVESLATYTPNLVTQLYDKNGNVFTTFARERRVMLKESEMPRVMEQALVASEDSNFFQHGGIDALGIGRAALADFRARRVKEGASTITMQLSRTLFLSRERTWRRKVEEAFVAVELEKNYTKPQILTLYLNLVNLGHGNYGVEAASRYYFDKPAAKLTLPEAAMLVGIIPAPSHYSPYRTPELMHRQRDRVLRRMLDEKYIGQRGVRAGGGAADPGRHPGAGGELRPLLRRGRAEVPGDQLRRDQPLHDGLQVQTTLDPQIQKSAQQAIHAGLLKIDHRRGWRGPIAEIKEADIARPAAPDLEPVQGRARPLVPGAGAGVGAEERQRQDRQGGLHPRPRGDRLDQPPPAGRLS